jgi:proline iminopeptidase
MHIHFIKFMLGAIMINEKMIYTLNSCNGLYNNTQPYDHGMLNVGDGHSIYWETCGNPKGKPVLIVHGGPGSGATAYWRQFFDPKRYQIILFDQRGCGRSIPHAGDTIDALKENTTAHLISDIEKIRTHFNIDKWMLFAGSWGTTLSLAYAVSFPDLVTELILWAVVTTRKHEIDWLTWTMGELFPEEFKNLVDLLPEPVIDGNIPLSYNKLLVSPDPLIHVPASHAWCAWEDRITNLGNTVISSPRYQNDRFRLGFTRLVTHYFGHYAFLPDDFILSKIENLRHLPIIMVRGRLDIASPLSIVWNIHQSLPLSDLYLIDEAGHGGAKAMHQILVGATDFFAK